MGSALTLPERYRRLFMLAAQQQMKFSINAIAKEMYLYHRCKQTFIMEENTFNLCPV